MSKKPIPMPVSQKEIYDAGMQMTDKTLRALFFYLYLSGARVSEALAMRRKDVQIMDGRVVAFSLTLKNRKENKRYIPLSATKVGLQELDEKMLLEFLTCSGLQQMTPEERLFPYRDRSDVFNRLKRGGSSPKFKTMDLENGKQTLTTVEWSPNPHYLRHCRATHLASHIGPYVMMSFFGWSSTEMPMKYVQRTALQILKEI